MELNVANVNDKTLQKNKLIYIFLKIIKVW